METMKSSSSVKGSAAWTFSDNSQPFSGLIPNNKVNGKENPILEGIRNDIRLMGHVMKEFSMTVISQEVSRYPVYVATQSEIGLGRPFLSKEMYNLNWHYRASVLEEFVKHQVVDREKLDDFRETFGDPEERACIFVMLPNEGGFVFVPYLIEE